VIESGGWCAREGAGVEKCGPQSHGGDAVAVSSRDALDIRRPGNALAEDCKPAATLSNPDPDHKDKRRDRDYDRRSVYHSYRDRYEPDSRRYRNQDWTNAQPRDRDHPAVTKDDD
jgi:hypothetical protein